MKKQIFCFNNGGPYRFLSAIAMAEDGHMLGGHICSHEGFMMEDLGKKHEQYDKHFGEGNWELEWVSDPKTHAGLKAAYELNQQLAAADAAQ